MDTANVSSVFSSSEMEKVNHSLSVGNLVTQAESAY